MEIFADTFSHEGEGLKSGERVAPVAYWSAVVMAGVRLGRRFVLDDKIKTSQAFIYSFHSPCGKIYHQFWQKNDVFYVNNSYNYVPSSLWNCSLFEHWTLLQVCSNCPDLLPSLLPTARSSDLPQSPLVRAFPQ